jgi:hypothetical protein
MSTEMESKKKEEIEEVVKQEEIDEEAVKKDACPHCLQLITSYPYVVSHPMLGWVECAACGVIFSPKSIRNLKIKRAKSPIILPK